MIYIGGSCHQPWGERRSFTTATGHLLRHQIRHSSAGGGELLLAASVWRVCVVFLQHPWGKHRLETLKKNMWNTTVSCFGVSFGIIRCKRNPPFAGWHEKLLTPPGQSTTNRPASLWPVETFRCSIFKSKQKDVKGHWKHLTAKQSSKRLS